MSAVEDTRPKRGRLSSIDLLPDEARPHVIAALTALKERRRTQEEIREELNSHLLALGLDPISRTAFNRKALQIAAFGQELIQAREIAAILAEKLGDAPEGDVGLLLNETLKTMVYDLIMGTALDDEAASVKMMNQAALTLFRLEQARKISVVTRKRIIDDFAVKAGEAVEQAAKAKGLSHDTVEDIKSKILGITRQ